MLWHILKYYMGYVLGVYFKRYQVKNLKHIKVTGPVVIAMNHPNGFMDPSIFSALAYAPRARYLARGDAFKEGIVTKLLESLGIIPIFRIQDGGKEGLKKNDETYEQVNQLLKRNKKVIIFAEGLCVQERRLRPLKKGVPRMIFGAMEECSLKDFTVVPVGLNYSNPSQFRTTLFVNIGEPIVVANYMNDYKEAPAKTMNQFLADLKPKMKELIVHINETKSEKVIAYIEEIYKETFIKNKKFSHKNLEHDFIFSTHVAEIINKAEINCEKEVRDLEEKASSYLADLKRHSIKNWLINENKKSINWLVFLLRFLLIGVTLPLYITGVICNYLPYWLTDKITTKKVKKVEFKASFRLGIGAMVFLIWYSLLFTAATLVFDSCWFGLLIISVASLVGLFCVLLSPFRKKTFGMYRFLVLKQNNKTLVKSFITTKKEIIDQFEELQKVVGV